MDHFLDMCIIICYASQTGSKKEEKIKDLIKSREKNRFLVCYYIFNENLPKWIKRQKIIIREIIRKIKDDSYEIGESDEGRYLVKKDKNDVKKILFRISLCKDKMSFIQNLERNNRLIEKWISYFLKNYIDEKVIDIKDIDVELRSKLLSYLEGNISDANTIASGIQQHNKKELIMFTSDKKHWVKENLEEAVFLTPSLRKRGLKIPDIEYI